MTRPARQIAGTVTPNLKQSTISYLSAEPSVSSGPNYCRPTQTFRTVSIRIRDNFQKVHCFTKWQQGCSPLLPPASRCQPEAKGASCLKATMTPKSNWSAQNDISSPL